MDMGHMSLDNHGSLKMLPHIQYRTEAHALTCEYSLWEEPSSPFLSPSRAYQYSQKALSSLHLNSATTTISKQLVSCGHIWSKQGIKVWDLTCIAFRFTERKWWSKTKKVLVKLKAHSGPWKPVDKTLSSQSQFRSRYAAFTRLHIGFKVEIENKLTIFSMDEKSEL